MLAFFKKGWLGIMLGLLFLVFITYWSYVHEEKNYFLILFLMVPVFLTEYAILLPIYIYPIVKDELSGINIFKFKKKYFSFKIFYYNVKLSPCDMGFFIRKFCGSFYCISLLFYRQYTYYMLLFVE